MNPIVIIPARMASTRLPGKPLADIGGAPMIARVWRQAVAAKVARVVVAAAEQEIACAIERLGGSAVLTDPEIASGTDRVFAALQIADPSAAHDVVVNLQGDLPLLEPAHLNVVIETLHRSGADVATLAAPIVSPEDWDNPSVVKPVVAWENDGNEGRALYFSRARAPFGEGMFYHHIGIYAFRRAALARFVALPPSPLERRENLEQLRALEAGMTIAVGRVAEAPLSVDTEADLAKARAAALTNPESTQ